MFFIQIMAGGKYKLEVLRYCIIFFSIALFDLVLFVHFLCFGEKRHKGKEIYIFTLVFNKSKNKSR